MASTVHRERLSRGFRAAEAAVLAIILALAAVSVASLAAGHLQTAGMAFLVAASFGVSEFLLRLHWREKQFTRSLILQNARLLYAAAGKAEDGSEEEKTSA